MDHPPPAPPPWRGAAIAPLHAGCLAHHPRFEAWGGGRRVGLAVAGDPAPQGPRRPAGIAAARAPR